MVVFSECVDSIVPLGNGQEPGRSQGPPRQITRTAGLHSGQDQRADRLAIPSVSQFYSRSRQVTRGLHIVCCLSQRRLATNRAHRKLDSVQGKLESLNPKDKGRIRKLLHKMSSVDSDREEIDSCSKQLDGSFQQFMVRFRLSVFPMAYSSSAFSHILHCRSNG